jgi:deoxycytidylate deaminase
MNTKTLYKRLNKLKEHLEQIPIQQKFRLGAIILDKYGIPISIGFNSYVKTHPVMLNFRSPKVDFGFGIDKESKIFLHAEMDCLIKGLSKKSEWHTLIVARIGADGELKLAKPCQGCSEMLKGHFKNIYYTDNSGNLILMKSI